MADMTEIKNLIWILGKEKKKKIATVYMVAER